MSPQTAILLDLAILSPLIIPAYVARAASTHGDICKDVVCGKGRCKESTNVTSQYECICDPGWKQAVSDDASLRFLPCSVPNCTLNSSCSKAQSPALDKSANQTTQPFYSPCRWVDCGGGTCNETSAFSYSCICEAGYSNLLNISAFPCYQQCQIGLNCANLGVSVSNASSSPSITTNNGTNQGTSIMRGRTWWPSIFLISLIALLHQ